MGRYRTIRDFTDIEAWRQCREIRKDLFRIVKSFPKCEYKFIEQIKSAAISTTANIAEGYGRFHYRENIQFCRISRGSLAEIRDHLISGNDEGLIGEAEFSSLMDKAKNAERVLNGYIRWLEKQRDMSSPPLRASTKKIRAIVD